MIQAPGEKGPIGDIGRQGTKGEEGPVGIAGTDFRVTEKHARIMYNYIVKCNIIMFFVCILRTTGTAGNTGYAGTRRTERRSRRYRRQR